MLPKVFRLLVACRHHGLQVAVGELKAEFFEELVIVGNQCRRVAGAAVAYLHGDNFIQNFRGFVDYFQNATTMASANIKDTKILAAVKMF